MNFFNHIRWNSPLNLLVLLSISILSFHCTKSESCLPSNTSFALYSLSGRNSILKSKFFTVTEFHDECHEHFAKEILDKPCPGPLKQQRIPPTKFEKYVYGFLAVFLVSAIPLAGLLAFPIIHKVSFQYVLSLFIALAVGTLFGDTMFHLIPLALGLHGDHGDHGGEGDHGDHGDHSHQSFSVPNYVWKMLLSVLILYSFYLLEVLLHSFAHYKHQNASSVHFHARGHSHSIPHHNHSHSDGEVCEQTPLDIDADLEHGHRLHNLHQHTTNQLSASSSTPAVNHNYPHKMSSTCVPCAYSNDTRATVSLMTPDHDAPTPPVSVTIADAQPNTKNPVMEQLKMKAAYTPGVKHAIKSTGWMVLIGDGIHNFADGLAMGAAFSQNLVLGMTTTLAVAFHELPHEFGDYAVLIQSGFSHYRAILWNFLSATTAMIGFFISVTFSSDETVRQWIFAITIGMFLYIALVDLLPTLLPDGQVEVKRFIVVNIGFLLGIAIMFLLALFEDSIIRSS